MRARFLVPASLLALAAAVAAFAAGPVPAGPFPVGESIHRLPLRGAGVDHVNFLVYIPPSYARAPRIRYPLIVYLHGTEQRGDNPGRLREVARMTFVDANATLPFIAVFPQCPSNAYWAPGPLKAVIDSLEQALRIDTDRIYLTGFSLGGYGTWQTAAALPDLFAAIAPLCGMSDIPDVPRLRDIPVWAFHGALDQNVPLAESQKMTEALRSAGGNVRLTVYPQFAHEIWAITYRDSRLYLWFLAQKRGGESAGAGAESASAGEDALPALPAASLLTSSEGSPSPQRPAPAPGS
jgi:poly(3-hydroxybutyrate) depolymerase